MSALNEILKPRTPMFLLLHSFHVRPCVIQFLPIQPDIVGVFGSFGISTRILNAAALFKQSSAAQHESVPTLRLKGGTEVGVCN